jgi:hypothetical protein
MPRTFHRHARPFLALAGLVLLLAAGCENLIHPQYRFAQVRVRTVDPSGGPVPDVPVVLYTGLRVMGEATTGRGGEHLFTEVAAGATASRSTCRRGIPLAPASARSLTRSPSSRGRGAR